MKHLILSLLLSYSAHAAIDPVVDAGDKRLPESEAIASAANTQKAKRRALAALVYGQIMSPKTIDPLIKLSSDRNPWVREEAAFALGQLGWIAENTAGHEEKIEARLTEMLHDTQKNVRVQAVTSLGKVSGADAEKWIAPSLDSKEPEIRAAAVMAFFRARMILKLRDAEHPPGAISDALRARFTQLAEDKDANVRQSIAYFFARNSEPKMEAVIAKLTKEKNPDTRMFAAMALMKMKAKGSNSEIDALLHDSEYTVRTAAVGAKAASGTALPPSLATDRIYHVRAALAAALSAEKADEAALLQKLLKDESSTVGAEAFKAIAKAKKGQELSDFLHEGLLRKEWQLREAAVQSADPLDQDAKEKFLKEALAQAGHKLVRAAALEAWFALPTQAAFEQLKESLNSPELSERATAVGALKDRKEDGIVDLGWKTYQNSLDGKWVETREDLLEIFTKTQNETTTGYLKQILSDPDRSVQSKARKALQTRGATDLPEVPEADLTYSPFRNNTFVFFPLPRVELETSKGTMTIELYVNESPIHVADFIGHVKAGFYNGLSWHRVISNFVIQGGDPDGSGFGGAGYALRAEINRRPFVRGALGMPRSQGFDTGGGQLFFAHIPVPHLDGQYTVFGRVIKGLDVIDRIERGDAILKARVLSRFTY